MLNATISFITSNHLFKLRSIQNVAFIFKSWCQAVLFDILNAYGIILSYFFLSLQL